MHQLTEEILASREWRIRELEALKKIGIIALNEYPLKVKQQYYRMCMLDAYPSLRKMYSADDGNTEVFYFKNATATFSSFTHDPEVVKF